GVTVAILLVLWKKAMNLRNLNTKVVSARCGKIDAVWSSLTRQFIPYLIDAAQVSTSRRIRWNGMFQRRVISSKPSTTRESAQLDCWRVKHRTGSRRPCERLKLVSDATQKAIGSPFQWPRTLSSHRNVERQIDFAGIKLEGRAQLRLFEEDEAEGRSEERRVGKKV